MISFKSLSTEEKKLAIILKFLSNINAEDNGSLKTLVPGTILFGIVILVIFNRLGVLLALRLLLKLLGVLAYRLILEPALLDWLSYD